MIVLTSAIYSVINLRFFCSVKCLNINLLLCLQKRWSFILFWCDDLSPFLHSHYFYTVFIFCKCYYKELVWLIPNSVGHFRYYKIFYEMFFFLSETYLKTTFYTAQKFLYQLRFFILSVLLLNWKKTCWVDLFLPVLSSCWTSG